MIANQLVRMYYTTMKTAMLFTVLSATTATADPACFDREALVAMLDTDRNERQAVTSIEDRGGIVEVYVAPDGSWSLIAGAQYDGPLCIVATGTKWQMIGVGS